MTTGILYINFDHDVTEEEIQEIVNDFYMLNRRAITGMEYNEFDSLQTLQAIKTLAKSYCSANSKPSSPQTTLLGVDE